MLSFLDPGGDAKIKMSILLFLDFSVFFQNCKKKFQILEDEVRLMASAILAPSKRLYAM